MAFMKHIPIFRAHVNLGRIPESGIYTKQPYNEERYNYPTLGKKSPSFQWQCA